MVLIGYPVWYGDRNLDHVIASISRAGFSYIEVSLDYPWPFKHVDKLNNVIRLAREYSLRVGVHGPWRDIALASPIENIRRASIEVYKSLMENVALMDPLYLNVHLATTQIVDIERDLEKESIDAAMRSVEELYDIAREYGVDLVVENDPGKCCSLLDHLAPIKDRVEKVFFCFDIGHAVIAYHRKMKRSREEVKVDYLELARQWATVFERKLILLHLHDYRYKNGHVEDHLPPGTHNVNVKNLLKALRDTGIRYVLLEVFYEEGGKHASPEKLVDVVRDVKTWSTALLYP